MTEARTLRRRECEGESTRQPFLFGQNLYRHNNYVLTTIKSDLYLYIYNNYQNTKKETVLL